jgi:autotransporter-associated beta strand protein
MRVSRRQHERSDLAPWVVSMAAVLRLGGRATWQVQGNVFGMKLRTAMSSWPQTDRGRIGRRPAFLIVFELLLVCVLSYAPAAVAQTCGSSTTNPVTCSGNLVSSSTSSTVSTGSGANQGTITPAVGFGPTFTAASTTTGSSLPINAGVNLGPSNSTTIGQAANVGGTNGITFEVGPGSVSAFDLTSISVGDNNNITILSGTTVTTTTSFNNSNGSKYQGTGPNTIEVGRNNTITIQPGAMVSATDTLPGSGITLMGSAQSEAINVMGFGNTIINRGTIFSDTSAAIWLQNNVSPTIYGNGSGGFAPGAAGAANTSGRNDLTDVSEAGVDGGRTPFPGNFGTLIYNYGVIEALTGANTTASGQAIGQSGNSQPTLFVNEPGAQVIGNVTMGSANDTVALFTGSTITGSLDGGGGSNTLILDAVVDNSLPIGELDGALTNFQTLTKLGNGEWVITGAITASTGSVTATVQEGTLTLTGENTNFSGTMTVDPGAVLQIGRISSAGILVPSDGTSGSFAAPILDNGTVAFNHSDNVSQPSGAISGSGQVGQIGTGILTLTTNNTYTGGTFINSGTLNVSSDSASASNPLGGPNGPLIFNAPTPINTIPNPGSPATFQFGSDFDLNPTRAITINAPSGTFDTQEFTSTITQGITGAGSLIKIGSGTLILNGNNTYSGGTAVNVGTLVVGDPDDTAAALSGGGPVSVAPGATLGGFASVTGDVTNDGTVAAGNATPGYASAIPGSFTITGNMLNNGVVALTQPDPTVGTDLVLHGNYAAGPSGTLLVSTALNAGGPLSNQITDRLLVFGNASGITRVQVVNLGGSGAITSFTGRPDPGDGISIVQVSGKASPLAFQAVGGYVDGGTPFQYHLNGYGPGFPNGAADPSQDLVSDPAPYEDFRLQTGYITPLGPVVPVLPSTPGEEFPPGSTPPPDVGTTDSVPDPGGTAIPPLPPDARPQVAPQVPAYISTARGLFQAGLLDIGTLHQRLGEIQDDQTLDREGTGEVFVRGYGGLFNYTTNRSFVDYGYNFNEDYAAVQFGGSYNAIHNEYGTLRVGLAGAIGRMWLQPDAIDGMSKALFNTQNFFGTVTWQDRTGWYVDGIIMGGLFDGRYTTPNRGQTTGMNGTTVGASIESGIPFALP